MTKIFSKKIFASIALAAIMFLPAVSVADYQNSRQNNDSGFFSDVAAAFSMIKEDGLALVSDASAGAAILFESIKGFLDKIALSFYKIISAIFIRDDDNSGKTVAVKMEEGKKPTTDTSKNVLKTPSPEPEKSVSAATPRLPVRQVSSSNGQAGSSSGISVPAIAQSSGSQPNVIERVVERIVEKPVSSEDAVSKDEFSTTVEQLKNKLFSEIYKVSAAATQPVYQAISLTNKIDTLNGVTISNSTFSGSVSGLTDSMIPNDITVSGYLPLSGGTLTGALTTYASATSTFAGQSLFSYVPSIVHTFSSWVTGVAGANPLGAALIINPASATADSNLFSVSVADAAKFLIDAEGDVFANSLTAAGGVTLSTTTASTFSVENNSTFGDATTTDKTYFNSRIGTSLVPTVTNALDLGDTTNGLAWRTGIFGTSIGIGTTSPYAALSVVGETVSTYFTATSTTATSTFMGVFSIGSTTPSSSALFSVGTSSPLFLVDKSSGNISINNLFSVLGTGTSTIAGNLKLTAASSSLSFGNSWRLQPTVATTSEITVYDSSGNAAFVFDEN